jgi:predicted small secreted protein
MSALKVDTDNLRRNRWVKTLSKYITLEVIYVFVGVLLTGGLVNYLLEGSSVPASVVITRSLQTQSILETVTYIIATAMGVTGTYMLARSSQPSKTGRESFLVFVTGILILMIGFFLFFSLYNFKTGG